MLSSKYLTCSKMLDILLGRCAVLASIADTKVPGTPLGVWHVLASAEDNPGNGGKLLAGMPRGCVNRKIDACIAPRMLGPLT